MAVSTRNSIVTNGLVLYLDAANSKSYVSGSTTWRDVSGNGNTGTLINGPTFNSGNGGSIDFDGANDHISLPSNSIGNLISGASASTFSIWLNNDLLPTVGVENYQSIGFAMSTFNNIVCTFFGSNIRVGGRSRSTDSFQGTTTPFLTTNTWVNIAGVLDYAGDIVEIYINGTLAVSTSVNFSSSTYLHTSSALVDSIGRSATSINSYNGKIGVVQLYNRKLIPQEIQQNYNATKTRFNLT